MVGGGKLNPKRGFTLVEIIAIIAIVAVCSALFKAAYVYRTDSIKSNIAREELSLLNCALEFYKSKNGHYPVCALKSMDENAKILYASLSEELNAYKREHTWMIKGGKLIDPWGHPYFYRCDSAESVDYKLFSLGPNGSIDEEAWIDDIYSR